MIVSKFNKRNIWQNLILVILAAVSLCGVVAGIRIEEWLIHGAIIGIVVLLAVVFWLLQLKVITINGENLEVRRVCLPFTKHYYRFAEFDSFLLYQSGKTDYLYLLRQGRRVIKMSSDIYENFEELKKTLSVIGGETWGVDAARAVDSVFSKKHLLAVSCLFLFVLVGLAVPVSDYFEKGYVRESSLIIGLVVTLFFLFLVIVALYPCRHLTIWRGNLEVKHMLWPFKVKYYSLEDFDFSLEIITKSQYGQEESLWLVLDDKLAVSIPHSVYANYDALERAIGIVPSDTIETNSFKTIPYYFGKRFDI